VKFSLSLCVDVKTSSVVHRDSGHDFGRVDNCQPPPPLCRWEAQNKNRETLFSRISILADLISWASCTASEIRHHISNGCFTDQQSRYSPLWQASVKRMVFLTCSTFLP
jgi:hypothetical protein